MAIYKLELTIEANTPEEAADKLFNELYNGSDNMHIEASDMQEVERKD